LEGVGTGLSRLSARRVWYTNRGANLMPARCEGFSDIRRSVPPRRTDVFFFRSGRLCPAPSVRSHRPPRRPARRIKAKVPSMSLRAPILRGATRQSYVPFLYGARQRRPARRLMCCQAPPPDSLIIVSGEWRATPLHTGFPRPRERQRTKESLNRGSSSLQDEKKMSRPRKVSTY